MGAEQGISAFALPVDTSSQPLDLLLFALQQQPPFCPDSGD